ncbi:phage tail protein, partial [Serratia marcescens]
EFYSPSNIHAGGAILAYNGDVYGSVWGNVWLAAWLNNQFAARDNNINTRATWDWVNQNFITNVRFSAERQVGASGVYTYHENTVLTGFNNRDADYSAESLFWSEIQIFKNGRWLTIGR